MAYNITSWATLKIEGFKIPIDAFYDSVGEKYRPEQPKILDERTNQVKIELPEDEGITGIIKDGILHVEEIKVCGECSGSCFGEVVYKAFEKSTGLLVIRLVWEGGDYIQTITVNNGEISSEDV